MKWIKLFEGFNQHEKINFVNDKFFYFKIMRDLKEMNLEKIETENYIYFYNIPKKIKHLKFVYSKIIGSYNYRKNSYPMGIIYYPNPKNRHNYNLTPVYKKAVGDFFEKYENIRADVSELRDSWDKHRGNFRKLKSYKS